MTDNSEEMFPVVDEDGNILSAATRGECHGGSMMLHPVVHLHVFNSKGELYLQHRPSWKDIQPDKWDTATGGHIDLDNGSGHGRLHLLTLHRGLRSRCSRINETFYKKKTLFKGLNPRIHTKKSMKN